MKTKAQVYWPVHRAFCFHFSRKSTQQRRFFLTGGIVTTMLKRHASATLRDKAKHYPVVAITGPRQSGKSTLAKMLFPTKPYLSLEDLDHRQFALQDPRGFF